MENAAMQNAEKAVLTLAEFISTKRVERKLSLRQLAAQSGLARNTIFKLERGLIAQPRPDVLIALGRALAVPAADMFALMNYPSPEQLPSFGVYLRARYHELTPNQVAQLEGYFAAIAAQTDIDLHGPQPGEDEF